MKLRVYSEIGELKKVLMHRPSNEIENLTPDMLEKLLFEDIPHFEVALREHDNFADVLRGEGVEVFYLARMAVESISQEEVKLQFLSDFLEDAGIIDQDHKKPIIDYLLSFDNQTIINKLIAGIRFEEIGIKPHLLGNRKQDNYPFICDPIPNLYFTRDAFVVIGAGVCLNSMHTVTRHRETLFAKYIFDYHPEFVGQTIPFWYDREEPSSIEGGDILILNEETLAIGVSERTESAAIEKLCMNLFNTSNQSFAKIKTVLAFHIPRVRKFMHLDTIFTQIDYDKFTVFGGIEGALQVYAIRKNGNGLSVTKEIDNLKKILEKYLKREIMLIHCGGGDSVIAGREQWNEAANTLAIKPGEVVVYSRNYVTNRLLEDNGIKLHIIKGSELSRGRGGPRCMTMPLVRLGE